MRSRNWMRGTMLLLALAPPVFGGSAQGRTVWTLSAYTWIKRVPAEGGAPPNAHPARVTPEALQSLLGVVEAEVDRQQVPLFGRSELKELAAALSEALALAQPGEDLLLLATSRHGGGFLDRAEGLTARVFLRDGALNLIVHDARLNFLDDQLLNNREPTFVYGSRKAPSGVALRAPGATLLRPDWLALALPPPPPPPRPVEPAPAPVPTPVPAPVAVPAPAPAQPTPVTRDEAAYQEKAQRLRTLQRLRDDHLISEAEYQARREAILKEL
jgi:hypothetical protein